MTQAISLHSLLMKAFEDLQAHDEAGELRALESWAPPPATEPDEDSILVIKTNHAANNSWLLLAVIRARGKSSGHTLLVTPDSRAHLLGHTLIASCLPELNQGDEHLEHTVYMSIYGVCNSFAKHPVALLVRDRKQHRTNFIRQVRHVLNTTNTKVLIVDQPKRCFPRQPKGNRAWRDAIPPSIRAVASIYRLEVVVLDPD